MNDPLSEELKHAVKVGEGKRIMEWIIVKSHRHCDHMTSHKISSLMFPVFVFLTNFILSFPTIFYIGCVHGSIFFTLVHRL